VVGEALLVFNRMKDLYPIPDFWKWAETSYLPIAAAYKLLRLAQTELYQAIRRFYGPNYGEYATYLDGVANAQSIVSYQGYVLCRYHWHHIDSPDFFSFNRDGVVDNGDLIEQAIDAALKGQKLPDPVISQSTMRVPAFYIPNYSNTLQRWIESSKQGAPRSQVISINIDENQDNSSGLPDWTPLGFRTIHPTLRGTAQNWPFLSVDNENKNGKPITLKTDGREQSISLKLAMIGNAKFDIRAGQW
jgi:hypothetical protein